jgi:hypothetical protein
VTEELEVALEVVPLEVALLEEVEVLEVLVEVVLAALVEDSPQKFSLVLETTPAAWVP